MSGRSCSCRCREDHCSSFNNQGTARRRRRFSGLRRPSESEVSPSESKGENRKTTSAFAFRSNQIIPLRYQNRTGEGRQGGREEGKKGRKSRGRRPLSDFAAHVRKCRREGRTGQVECDRLKTVLRFFSSRRTKWSRRRGRGATITRTVSRVGLLELSAVGFRLKMVLREQRCSVTNTYARLASLTIPAHCCYLLVSWRGKRNRIPTKRRHVKGKKAS